MNTVSFNYWKESEKIIGVDSTVRTYRKRQLRFSSNEKLERFLENHWGDVQHVIVWLDPEMNNEEQKFDFDLTLADEQEYADEMDHLRFALSELSDLVAEDLGMVEA